MRAFLLFLLLALIYAVSAQQIWSECGSGNTLKIETLTFDPPEPIKGKNITVHFKGELTQTITAAKAKVHITYKGFKILDKVLDVCKEIAKGTIHCPLQAGPIDLTHSELVPNTSVPPRGGPYAGYAIVTDQTGKNVTCINFKLNLH